MKSSLQKFRIFVPAAVMAFYLFVPTSDARDIPIEGSGQSIDQMVQQVDKLVQEMTALTNNLKEAIHPETLRKTVEELNRTLQNASQTLSPQGDLTVTAQRSLSKLEDAIEQFRDVATRVNLGQGSVGRVLNDEVFAQELETALRGINQFLGQASGVQFFINLSAEELDAYDGARGQAQVEIWPTSNRYYRAGIAVDPRGSQRTTVTTTRVGDVVTTTQTTQVVKEALLYSAMAGVVLKDRLDLGLGVLYSFGTLRVAGLLGPVGAEWRYRLVNELYVRPAAVGRTNGESSFANRIYAQVQPWSIFYVSAGVEALERVDGQIPFSFGAGIRFSDDHIKTLFSFL
jgi:phospholipid/cholesterol/gamma-HCH transport system substrate-binding protein